MGKEVVCVVFVSAVLLGIATNLDNLLIGLSAGARGKKITFLTNCIIALSSGAVSYLLCRLGVFSVGIGRISNWLGGGLLVAIGLWPLLVRPSGEHAPADAGAAQGRRLSAGEVLTLSLALAFNCLPASFAAGLTGIPAQAAALAVTLCSLGFVWLGQGLGKRLEDGCPADPNLQRGHDRAGHFGNADLKTPCRLSLGALAREVGAALPPGMAKGSSFCFLLYIFLNKYKIDYRN